MSKNIIVGIRILDRIKEAQQTQKVFSDFSHLIKTRLGFHEVTADKCSRQGLLFIQVYGKEKQLREFSQALTQIRGISLDAFDFNTDQETIFSSKITIKQNKMLRILGIRIQNRSQQAENVQHLLTEYGCSIKTRLGLHEVTDDHCSVNGLVLLELTGNPDEMDNLENKLLALEGVDVRKMQF